LATARSVLEMAAGAVALTRAELVDLGERLERDRPGMWLVTAISAAAGEGPIVVDAARTVTQLAALKRWRTSGLTVFLDAGVDVRRQRFDGRAGTEDMGFDEISASPIEREARALGPHCDLRFDSSELPSSAIAADVMAALEVR
jgi:hypothetical protein